MIRFGLAILLTLCYSLDAQESIDHVIGPDNVNVTDFCTTPSSNYVYSATNNRINLYEISSGQEIESIEYKETKIIYSIALTADSSYLIAGTKDGTIIIRDLMDRKEESIQLSESSITSVTVNSFGSRIAIGTSAGEIILANIFGGEVKRLRPHNDVVTDIEFSGDGILLVSSGMDGRIVVTSVSETPEFYCLKKTLSPCRNISISNNVQKLIASYDNGKVLKWTIKTDKTIVYDKKYYQSGWVTGVDFYHENHIWASCSSSGNIKIYSIFDRVYSAKRKRAITQIEFCSIPKNKLQVLVSVYNKGLLLISAEDMALK